MFYSAVPVLVHTCVQEPGHGWFLLCCTETWWSTGVLHERAREPGKHSFLASVSDAVCTLIISCYSTCLVHRRQPILHDLLANTACEGPRPKIPQLCTDCATAFVHHKLCIGRGECGGDCPCSVYSVHLKRCISAPVVGVPPRRSSSVQPTPTRYSLPSTASNCTKF